MESFRPQQKPLEKSRGVAEQPILHTELSERAAETYTALHDVLVQAGYREYEHIADMYKQLADEQLTVRREDPKKVSSLLAENSTYTISFEGTHYANCVEWNPARDGFRNISNAYLEGYGHKNAVVSVIGLRKNNHIHVERLPESIPDFYGLDRRGVRSMEGTVTSDDIAFVTLRVPGHLFPEYLMTEDEKDALFEYNEKKKSGMRIEPIMIHRGFLNTSHLLH